MIGEVGKRYMKRWTLEVLEISEQGDYYVQNEGRPDDRWWIPKDTFESTYTPYDYTDKTEFDFGMALRFLRVGGRVARKGWNGKGMYLFMIGMNGDYWTYTNGKNDNYPLLPFIAIKTADDHVVPWLCSQTDALAEDWVIVL